MARAPTTTDAFNAVAEPRRRQLLEVLAGGERPVGELVAALGLPQPAVSKHLRVLREVGLVAARDDGRRRVYRLDPRPLAAIHAWVGGFEGLWSARFDALDGVLDDLLEEPHDDDDEHDDDDG
ncbi:MAG: metalloregulator ArsR/SmtB family transcription factor [Myxococcota bacterium]